MKNYLLILLSIIFLSVSVSAEPLVIYDIYRAKDSSNKVLTDQEIFDRPEQASFRKQIYSVLDPNLPVIGNSNDCYPDDPKNPKGNIVIRGKVTSKFDGKSINGAVVAVYMGMEHTNNTNANKDKFIIGDGGKLINFYSYDVTDEGYYEVYACNDYKKLSQQRSNELGSFCPDGYVLDPATNKCTHYDYVHTFPKFYVTVLCGMVSAEEVNRSTAYQNRQLTESSQLKPWIGEVLSVDNFNDPYKVSALSTQRPDFLVQDNLDLVVNCGSDIQPFPVPMFLNYTATEEVSSCRMEDINPNLVNYMVDTQKSLLTQPTPSIKPTGVTNTLPTPFPTFSGTSTCLPGDMFCPENFIKSVTKPPVRGENLFSYKNRNFMENSKSIENANLSIRQNIFGYDSPKFLLERTIDFESGNDASGDGDYLPQTRNRSTQGQVDAKLDVASAMTDLKFDISILKDLYSCFTTLNHPNTRSSAQLDEVLYGKTPNEAENIYFNQNIRIPSCRELYCTSEFTPDTGVCKIKVSDKRFGTDVIDSSNIGADPSSHIYLTALSGYGPALTALPADTNQDIITANLIKLTQGLINSPFNPKAVSGNAKYKQVVQISDIPSCIDDAGQMQYLNADGSTTYRHHLSEYNFHSPAPFISFLSLPYFATYSHSIGNDNYMNKTPLPYSNSFSETCQNGDLDTNPDQQFSKCTSAVIPGGVYSLYALNLISTMCNENLKVDLPGAGAFDNVQEGSNIYDGSLPKGFDSASVKRVDLALTRIGTPTSLCLCDPYDLKNCSDQNKLNNYLTKLGETEGLVQKRDGANTIEVPTKGYAVGSFIGGADQWDIGGQISNTVGELCEKSKTDNPRCNARIGSKRDVRGTSNFLGPTNTLNANWRFSYVELTSARTDLIWKMYLHYTTQPSSSVMDSSYLRSISSDNPPFKVFSISLSGQAVEAGDDNNLLKRSCIEWRYKLNCTTDPVTKRESCEEDTCNRGNCKKNGKDFECVKWEKFVWDNPKEEHVSDISLSEQGLARIDASNASGTKTNTPLITYLTEEAYNNPSIIEEGNPLGGVEGVFKLIQQSEDGTKGYVTATFEYFNEKYDPIPSIINKFQSLSVWGIIPGGDAVCRSPRLASLASFDTFELVTNQPSVGGMNLTGFSDSRGVSCNAILAEDLARCDSGVDVTSDDRANYGKRASKKYTNTPEIECKFRKCLQLCNQMYSSYYFYDELTGDGNEPQFFCANKYPKTKNVQMEFNSGNEGCVVEYFRNMKAIYKNPSRPNTPNLDNSLVKNLYRVYNNQICLNPTNPVNINGNSGPLADNQSCPIYLNKQFTPSNNFLSVP